MPINLKVRKTCSRLSVLTNISSAILAAIHKCESDFKQNSKQPWEFQALSASSPESPKYMICPFEQALYVQTGACKPECTIFVLNNRFNEGALKWERPPGTASKGKQKKKVKIKIETTARHDQMEYNTGADRHPNQKPLSTNTCITWRSQIRFPNSPTSVCKDSQKHWLLNETFSFFVWPLILMPEDKFFSSWSSLDDYRCTFPKPWAGWKSNFWGNSLACDEYGLCLEPSSWQPDVCVGLQLNIKCRWVNTALQCNHHTGCRVLKTQIIFKNC